MSNLPNSEQLQAIMDADAQAGDNLQMAPAVWTQRRQLLAVVANNQQTIENLTTALKVAVVHWEYWTDEARQLFDAAVELVGQVQGSPFDPVEYSKIVQQRIDQQRSGK